MKNTNPKISIIIPVYNAGFRLIRCMDTLINQTLSDIEIIIVLDCPTDGSDELVKKYAQQDERIKVVENEKNIHIGLSRNKGIDIARGEYIGFSDHDDYRELSMYEELYQFAKKNNSDLVIGKTINISNKTEIITYNEWDINKNVKESALNDLLIGGKDAKSDPKVTNIHPNIYRTSIIKDNNIRFVDTKKITPEDRIFNIEFLINSKSAMVYDISFYYHFIHENSEGRNQNYYSFDKRIAGKKHLNDFLRSNDVYQKYEDLFLLSVYKDFTEWAVNALFKSKNPFLIVHIINNYNTFDFFHKAFQNTKKGVFDTYKLGGKNTRKAFSFLMRCIVRINRFTIKNNKLLLFT